MAKSYYSTVFEQSADEVWAVIRDFGHYNWAGIAADVHIEDGHAGDAVGSIRNVRTGENIVRQRLLAHSDLDRSYTYEFCRPLPFPIRNYQATLRIVPIMDGNRSFIEWSATFDCDQSDETYWTNYFTCDGFEKWLNALRNYMRS